MSSFGTYNGADTMAAAQAVNIESTDDLSPLSKAAILLLALDPDSAAVLLKQLDPEAVENVTRELASMRKIDPDMRDEVLEEFYEMAMASAWASEGGLDYARSLLMKTLDPGEADRILTQISQQVRRLPFAFFTEG